MNKTKRWAGLLALVLALVFTGCSKEEKANILGITLPESVQILKGETLVLEPTISTDTPVGPEFLQEAMEGPELRWVTADPGVVTVSVTGLLTAFSTGETTVTLTTQDGAVQAVTNVVVYVPATEIIAEDMVLTTLDTTAELQYQVLPEGSKEQPEITVSGDCVSLDGTTLTVNHSGAADITIRMGETEKTIHVTVGLAPKELSIRNQGLSVGSTHNLFVWDGLGDYVEAEVGIDYTFTSEDPSIATIDENGQIKGVSRGQTTITVQNELGQSASAMVTVN